MCSGVERQWKRLIMKNTILISGVSVMLLGLAGCIHVDEGHRSDSEEISRNTDTALRVCGGPGTVADVSDEGFSCKTD